MSLQESNPAAPRCHLFQHSRGSAFHTQCYGPQQDAEISPQKDLWVVLGFDPMLSDPFDKHAAFQTAAFTSCAQLKWTRFTAMFKSLRRDQGYEIILPINI